MARLRSWEPISPGYVANLADEWERRDLPIVTRINRREQLYHCDWRVDRDKNREYLPSMAPQIMANRAMDKLCSQPPLLTVLDDAEEVLEDDTEGVQLAELASSTDPIGRQRAMAQRDASDADDHAETVEAMVAGLWAKIEDDQRVNLSRLISRVATVDAYTCGRVIYLMPDQVHDGEIPLRVQILDRRFYHDRPGPGGGAPEEVIYTRRDKWAVIRAEGWEVALEDIADEDTVRLTDYWRRLRVPKRLSDQTEDGALPEGASAEDDELDDPEAWETQVWHAILVDNGQPVNLHAEDEPDPTPGSGDFLGVWAKEPTLMPIAQIPYVLRKVRPTPTVPSGAIGAGFNGTSASTGILPYGLSYEAYEAMSFIEVFDEIWETMNRVRSYRAQGVRLAVDPPSVVKTRSGSTKKVETRLPGAQSTLDVSESVELILNPQIQRQAEALAEDLANEGQQATFTAASVGQGSYQSSGVMTERLQEAGAQSMTATKEACEGTIQDLVGLLAMFAKTYLAGPSRRYRLPGTSQVVRADFAKIRGDEVFRVKLPAMSKQELMQAIATAKGIVEPGADGWPMLSRETGRELAELPYPQSESRKIKRQMVEESDFMLDSARAKYWQKAKDDRALAAERSPGPDAAAPPGARPELPTVMPVPGPRTPMGRMGTPRMPTPMGGPPEQRVPWLPAEALGVTHAFAAQRPTEPIEPIQPNVTPASLVGRQPSGLLQRVAGLFRR